MLTVSTHSTVCLCVNKTKVERGGVEERMSERVSERVCVCVCVWVCVCVCVCVSVKEKRER